MQLWDHPNPVFIDFETQSATDLKEVGGRAYAGHPSTRVLILVACIDEVFHVWIPDYIRVDTSKWVHSRLWPHQITPAKEVRLYRDKLCPSIIIEASHNRPFIAHNAYGFDRQIWQCMDASRPKWADSLIIAKASGRSGKLDTLGQSILGQGKDRAKKLLPLLTKATYSHQLQSYLYPRIQPGDLQAFTTYAIADVALLKLLWEGEFANIAVEEDVVRVHDEINVRGVRVDLELLDTIESLAKYSIDNAINEIETLTDGRINANNIRSIKQMHEWLESYGVTITDDNGKPCLRKEIVKRYIDSPYLIESNLTAAREIPPLVVKVLELRLKALRITTAKVERAKQRVRPDNRIRDLHSYHQAHPGRWSSVGVQIHNLPRPIKGVDTERILKRLCELKTREGITDIRRVYETVRGCIPESNRELVTVDDICSTLIRPVFVPKSNHLFVICDLSQIEARCLAWIADERKLLHIFKQNGDIYKQFGSRLYGCDPTEITGIKRDASKVIVLACIAEDTPVLTDNGWKVIQDVSKNDLIWDGIEFVSHDGLIDKGTKACIKVDDTWMTPDHKVLSSQGWLPAIDVISENIPFASGNLSINGQFFLNLNGTNEPTINADVPAELFQKYRERILSVLDQLDVTNVQKRNPETRNLTETISQTTDIEDVCSIVSHLLSPVAQKYDPKDIRIMVLGVLQSIKLGWTIEHYLSFILQPYQDGIIQIWRLIESITMGTMNRVTFVSPQEKSTRETLVVKRKRTYDFLNSGPRNQFQAGKTIVHNCGYGMGPDKLRVYCANAGIDLIKAGLTTEHAIATYRDTYTNICGFKPDPQSNFRTNGIWHKLDRAVKDAVTTREPQEAGKCIWYTQGRDLLCKLPSGRINYYNNARMEDIVPGYCYTLNLPLIPKPTIVYEGAYGTKSLYGGLITENVCQAICRDLLARALVLANDEGFRPVLHVHDEMVCEVEESKAVEALHRIVSIMSEVPLWAEGFPVACEGFVSPRFVKKPFDGYPTLDTHSLHKDAA